MENVLIISSNLMQSKRLDIILTLEGFYCIPVIEGSEAINLILKKPFDLIFFDEKTPNISLDDIKNSMKSLNLPVTLFVIKAAPQEQDIIKDSQNNIYYIDHSVISEKLPHKIKELLNSNL